MFGPTRRNIGGWTESDSWKFYAVKTYEDPADDGAIRAFGSRTVGPALPSGRSIRRRAVRRHRLSRLPGSSSALVSCLPFRSQHEERTDR
ncbi:hypothetical protein OPV22_030339 [Ensete ventricosum]|uniref:Protein kinase domain-containing protein n=1 Tax=Ensete ventricosum TaxID=4639 RepID=A0AAV8P888_ENSVE|nr:hypothetical protein OPV22_030339 [Ensete ventricosum]